MLAVRREPESATVEGQVVVSDLQLGEGSGNEMSVQDRQRDKSTRKTVMGKGYVFREANWSIGRAAEKAKVEVKRFVPGDRFTAWRKSKARKEANAERKRLRTAQKAAKSKKRR